MKNCLKVEIKKKHFTFVFFNSSHLYVEKKFDERVSSWETRERVPLAQRIAHWWFVMSLRVAIIWKNISLQMNICLKVEKKKKITFVFFNSSHLSVEKKFDERVSRWKTRERVPLAQRIAHWWFVMSQRLAIIWKKHFFTNEHLFKSRKKKKTFHICFF